MHDPKRKRWTACGVCTACLATDCGDCINCLDKSKFGGQGVRKQSCVMRRCVRMTSNGSSGGGHGGGSSSKLAAPSPGHGSSDGAVRLDDAGRELVHKKAGGDSEQALFWAAVSGCLALNGGPEKAGYEGDDDATTRGTSFKDSCSGSPRSPEHSESDALLERSRERRSSGGEPYFEMPPMSRHLKLGSGGVAGLGGGIFGAIGGGSLAGGVGSSSGAPTTGADSFCCKLANVLASDKRLGTQPIALRALQRAGVVDPLATVGGAVSSAITPPNLAASLNDPQLVSQLGTHFGPHSGHERPASGLGGFGYGWNVEPRLDGPTPLVPRVEPYARDSAPRVELSRESLMLLARGGPGSPRAAEAPAAAGGAAAPSAAAEALACLGHDVGSRGGGLGSFAAAALAAERMTPSEDLDAAAARADVDAAPYPIGELPLPEPEEEDEDEGADDASHAELVHSRSSHRPARSPSAEAAPARRGVTFTRSPPSALPPHLPLERPMSVMPRVVPPTSKTGA